MVADYLAKASLAARLPKEQYEADLVERFGDAATQFFRNCRSDPSDNEESHALMSANLDMVLAIRGDFGATATKLFSPGLQRRTCPIADVFSILVAMSACCTCFYATFFPKSEIIGIDRCRKSVQCAKQLAERLNLKNVQFVQADLRALPDALTTCTFNMVVSSCVAGHFYDEVTLPVRSIEETESQAITPNLAEYAGRMAGLLADDTSLLVSFERFGTPIQFARWIWALRNAGVYAHRDRITLLEVVDEVDDLPVVVGTKRATAPFGPNEIRDLWMKDFREHGRRELYRRAVAEHRFVTTNPKELLHGFRHTPSGSSEYCKELWKSESDMLFYLYCDGGVIFAEHPMEDLPAMLESLRLAARDDSRGESIVEYGPEVDSAISRFTEAVRLDPTDLGAYYDRALAYSDRGDHDKAIEDWTEIIRLDPTNAQAYATAVPPMTV